MTKKTAKNAHITVNGVDLSTACVTFEIMDATKAEDAVGFQDGVENYAAGQNQQSVVLEFLYDDYGASGSLVNIQALVGVTSAFPVVVQPVPSGKTFTLQSIIDGGITVTGESKGTLVKLGKVKFVPGTPTRGTWA